MKRILLTALTTIVLTTLIVLGFKGLIWTMDKTIKGIPVIICFLGTFMIGCLLYALWVVSASIVKKLKL